MCVSILQIDRINKYTKVVRNMVQPYEHLPLQAKT